MMQSDTIRAMRTTVDFETRVLRQVKARADAQHQTLSRFVQEAVLAYLATPAKARQAAPFTLVTCGVAGDPCPTPAEIADQLAGEDAAALRIPGIPHADA